MGSEILPAAGSWAGWRWVAVGLATAVALGRLAALIAGVSSTPSNSVLSVFSLAWLLAGLVELAVVMTGVWLAAQRHGHRLPLGLAVLATASALGRGEVSSPVSPLLIIGDIVVLAVALLALRARQDRYRLSAERPRKEAAVAIGVWGVANLWPAPVVIAIVVWQRDSLTMVATTLTATVYAVTQLAPEMAALISHAAPAELATELEPLLHAGAAGLLVAACTRLVLAARATWRFR